MLTKTHILKIIAVLLLALWIPTSLDKLMNFDRFKADIGRQPLNESLLTTLAYILPFIEISIVIWLVVRSSRWVGYGLSSLLMVAFTGFVWLAWQKAWPKLPCGCGKLISTISWQQHFWFNLFFLIISILGLLLTIRQRKKLKSNFAKNTA